MQSLSLACGMFPSWGLGISLPGSIIRKDNHLLCWWSPQSFCGWQLFEAWGFGNQAVRVEIFVGKCVVSGELAMLLYRLNLGNNCRGSPVFRMISIPKQQAILHFRCKSTCQLPIESSWCSMRCRAFDKDSFRPYAWNDLGWTQEYQHVFFQWRFIINVIQTTDTLSFKYQMHTLVHHSNNNLAGDWATLLWQRPATTLASLWTGCEGLGGCRTTGRKPMAAIPGMAWPSISSFSEVQCHFLCWLQIVL